MEERLVDGAATHPIDAMPIDRGRMRLSLWLRLSD
jgi:hypothetical protein